MQQKARFPGFDFWRAGLLLLGPIVHGSPSVPGHRVQWLETLTQSSHLFRMEAFFAISGFLMIQINYSGRSGWMNMRICQLLVPAVATWLFLDVPVVVFLRWWGSTDISVTDPMHLWFLFDLTAATLLICWLDLRGLLAVGARRWPLWIMAWLSCTIVAQMFLYKTHTGSPVVNIVTGLPYYTCFFFVGAVIAHEEQAIRWLRTTRFWWVGIPMMIVALYVFNANYSLLVDPERSERHLLFRATYQSLIVLCATFMTITVLATALRVRREHSWLRTISQSSYTIYLAHMSVALVVTALLGPLSLPTLVQFLAVVCLSLGVSWAFHRWVIDRSEVAAFLFNGRPLRRPSTSKLVMIG